MGGISIRDERQRVGDGAGEERRPEQSRSSVVRHLLASAFRRRISSRSAPETTPPSTEYSRTGDSCVSTPVHSSVAPAGVGRRIGSRGPASARVQWRTTALPHDARAGRRSPGSGQPFDRDLGDPDARSRWSERRRDGCPRPRHTSSGLPRGRSRRPGRVRSASARARLRRPARDERHRREESHQRARRPRRRHGCLWTASPNGGRRTRRDAM